MSYNFTHLWILRKKTKKKEKQKTRLKRIERGKLGAWVQQIKGIRGHLSSEHRVIHGTVESLYGTPETNLTL